MVGLERRPVASPADRGLVLRTASHREVRCGALILTAGIGTFRPRLLPVGEEHLGCGLMYFVPPLGDLAGRDIMIVGGGDSAFDWALNLHPVARSVTLVHRRDRFRAHDHTVRQVTELGVPILTFT